MYITYYYVINHVHTDTNQDLQWFAVVLIWLLFPNIKQSQETATFKHAEVVLWVFKKYIDMYVLDIIVTDKQKK